MISNDPIVIVGAGIGGLTAAAWLSKKHERVIVVEARSTCGGLASEFQTNGYCFDAGPYILLDRPGLEWIFEQLGESLQAQLDLHSLDEVYQVERNKNPTVSFFKSLEKTADHFESLWPKSGKQYLQFTKKMISLYDCLRPLQLIARPRLHHLIENGGWKKIPFLFQSLSQVLNRSQLPKEIKDALSIWTHVAGQNASDAPSALALIPALIHKQGAFVPKEGMAKISKVLEHLGKKLGVEYRYNSMVQKIHCSNNKISAIEINGELIKTNTVICNASPFGAYHTLLNGIPEKYLLKLQKMPLQSPGVCAYMAIKGNPQPPYLKFFLPEEEMCRLLVQPGVLDPEKSNTARLLGPVDHRWAQKVGLKGQQEYLNRLINEPWWKKEFTETKMIASRVPNEWSKDFNLFNNAMNPVMTAKLMRQGRMAYKSPFAEGLYFCGSATHPGQWISFCGISGILAAQEMLYAKNKN